MPLEIEKKYLVQEIPFDLADYPFKKIEQGYLSVEPEGTEVRVRRIGDEFFITAKSSGVVTRSEYEFSINRRNYDGLMEMTSGRQVQKRRYFIPHGKFTIELDVFEGKLKGLITAEVEFKNEAEADKFSPPDWFGKDVSAEGKYKNKNLAMTGSEH